MVPLGVGLVAAGSVAENTTPFASMTWKPAQAWTTTATIPGGQRETTGMLDRAETVVVLARLDEVLRDEFATV
jgi:hypothetical protein